MTRRIISLSILSIAIFTCLANFIFAQEQNFPGVNFDPQDKILILAPHPDDEVIGCAGVIQKARALNLPIHIVFLTYGDNNEWSFFVYRKHPVIVPQAVRNFGLIRHDEAIAADWALGVSPSNLTFLGYPDFETMNIWNSHWGKSPPGKGMLNNSTKVPYKNAFRPGAPFKGEEILKDIKTILLKYKPTKIFLSHPSDHNGDHRALFLFTQVALWDLENKIPKATLYPYLVHFKDWPMPRGFFPTKKLQPPKLLEKIFWQEELLNPDELNKKSLAIKKHRSQYISSPGYLITFVRPNELFGDYPEFKLSSDDSSISLFNEPGADIAELQNEHIKEGPVSFVGSEKHSLRLEDNKLVFNVEFSRPFAKTIGASIYLFGYRNDRIFAEMPKLNIRFGQWMFQVTDCGRSIPTDKIKIKRSGKNLTVKVPLEILGNPQQVLFSARTYLFSGVALDWISWHAVEIKNDYVVETNELKYEDLGD